MDTLTSGYRLMELIALSGEFTPELVSRLGISPSYGEKLITRLKEEKLIKTHYKDRLRGYRLTSRGKKLLLKKNPDRFSFYLDGSSDTNQPRSDLPRRLRLQQSSRVYVLLQNADVTFFRDEKPLLFQEGNGDEKPLPLPVFYHSREIKELGAEAVKINNSRTIGVLFTEKCIYAVFYTDNSLIKWEYKTEIRVKALLSYHISLGLLSGCYHPDTPIKALMIGHDMETSVKLLTSTGGYRRSYFYLDTSFDVFHFIPDNHAGEILIRLLCSPSLSEALRQLLLSDLKPTCPDYGLEYDAVSEDMPVLLAYDFDMLRISRFLTGLSMHRRHGIIICFDFQKEALLQYCGESVTINTIDLAKFERGFLH